MQGAAQHRLAVFGTGTGWEIHLDPACPDETCTPCDTIRTRQGKHAGLLAGEPS